MVRIKVNIHINLHKKAIPEIMEIRKEMRGENKEVGRWLGESYGGSGEALSAIQIYEKLYFPSHSLSHSHTHTHPHSSHSLSPSHSHPSHYKEEMEEYGGGGGGREGVGVGYYEGIEEYGMILKEELYSLNSSIYLHSSFSQQKALSSLFLSPLNNNNNNNNSNNSSPSSSPSSSLFAPPFSTRGGGENYEGKEKERRMKGIAEKLLKKTPLSLEGWLLMGIYKEMILQPEKALLFYDKALSLNKKNVNANLLKGYLLSSLQKFHSSSKFFERAYSLNQYHIPSIKSLVNSYLETNQPQKASFIAKKAYEQLSYNPSISSLFGLVLCYFPKYKNEGMKILKNTLQHHPSHPDVYLSLSRSFLLSSLFNDSIQLLEENAKKNLPPLHLISLQLADSYFTRANHLSENNDNENPQQNQQKLSDLNSALENYKTALLLRPHSILARSGIQKCEKIMENSSNHNNTSNNSANNSNLDSPSNHNQDQDEENDDEDDSDILDNDDN